MRADYTYLFPTLFSDVKLGSLKLARIRSIDTTEIGKCYKWDSPSRKMVVTYLPAYPQK